MRLDWIFLPRENPCAKFYIIIIIIIMNLHRDMGKLEANETNVVENCVSQNQIRDPNASLERVECQEKSEIKNLILRK